MSQYDERRLKDWEGTLNERIVRCGPSRTTPHKSWYDALAAIDRYRADPNPENQKTLRVTLREAEIYVPREL